MRSAPTLAVALLSCLVLAVPVFATEPGAPLGCLDLVLAPGLSCTEFSQPGQGGFGERSLRTGDRGATVDNQGRPLKGGHEVIAIIGSCNARVLSELGLVFRLGDGATHTPLISVRERCSSGVISSAFVDSLAFDALRGALYLSMMSTGLPACFLCLPEVRPWIARIDGFTPLADVLPPPLPRQPLCSNGLDDDGDGLVDGEDAHCKSYADNDESRP